MEQQNMEPGHGGQPTGPSSEDKVLAGISHLAFFLSWWGLIGVIILYVLYKPKSPFVAQHAKQAAGYNIIATLLFTGLTFAAGAGAFSFGVLGAIGGRTPFALVGVAALFVLIFSVLGIIAIIFAIIAAVKGFTGQEYRYPVVGNFIHNINA